MTSANLELMLSAVFLDFFAGAMAALVEIFGNCQRFEEWIAFRSRVIVLVLISCQRRVCVRALALSER